MPAHRSRGLGTDRYRNLNARDRRHGYARRIVLRGDGSRPALMDEGLPADGARAGGEASGVQRRTEARCPQGGPGGIVAFSSKSNALEMGCGVVRVSALHARALGNLSSVLVPSFAAFLDEELARVVAQRCGLNGA